MDDQVILGMKTPKLLTCPYCGSEDVDRLGLSEAGRIHLRCRSCGRRWSDIP